MKCIEPQLKHRKSKCEAEKCKNRNQTAKAAKAKSEGHSSNCTNDRINNMAAAHRQFVSPSSRSSHFWNEPYNPILVTKNPNSRVNNSFWNRICDTSNLQFQVRPLCFNHLLHFITMLVDELRPESFLRRRTRWCAHNATLAIKQKRALVEKKCTAVATSCFSANFRCMPRHLLRHQQPR